MIRHPRQRRFALILSVLWLWSSGYIGSLAAEHQFSQVRHAHHATHHSTTACALYCAASHFIQVVDQPPTPVGAPVLLAAESAPAMPLFLRPALPIIPRAPPV